MLVLYNEVGGVVVCLFIIYYNVLDIDLYLCIVLEFYLKWLIVGGMEKVYEIGCVFCNEGIDIMYNLEFMMLEVYIVYIDFNDVMNLIEGIICNVVEKVLGIVKIIYDG